MTVRSGYFQESMQKNKSNFLENSSFLMAVLNFACGFGENSMSEEITLEARDIWHSYEENDRIFSAGAGLQK